MAGAAGQESLARGGLPAWRQSRRRGAAGGPARLDARQDGPVPQGVNCPGQIAAADRDRRSGRRGWTARVTSGGPIDILYRQETPLYGGFSESDLVEQPAIELFR